MMVMRKLQLRLAKQNLSIVQKFMAILLPGLIAILAEGINKMNAQIVTVF